MIVEELRAGELPEGDGSRSLTDRLFAAMRPLARPFLLESAPSPSSGCSRFTFLGGDPFLTFEAKGRKMRIVEGSRLMVREGNPFDELKRLMSRFGEPPHPRFPFTGGAVGYAGYESAEQVESLPERKRDSFTLPDMRFGFYDTVVIHDHLEGRSYISATGLPASGAEREGRARERIACFKALLSNTCESEEERPVVGPLISNFSRADYLAAVGKIKGYIDAGDIYQANLSQRFTAPFRSGSHALYRKMRGVNPVSFGAFLRYEDLTILSNSPERFLLLRNGRLETRPIKGTIGRGGAGGDDAEMVKKLKASTKDGAEHIMIVDLERNDLGRVCRYGTVTVDGLGEIESYSNLHHMVSTVSGQVREGIDAIDCIRAAFPGGSITGAPKVRAMEIINEVEPNPRWIYTGSIGYIGFDGTMDLNIAIRTAYITQGHIYFSVGGGIVADSDPEAEYEETLLKGEVFHEICREEAHGGA